MMSKKHHRKSNYLITQGIARTIYRVYIQNNCPIMRNDLSRQTQKKNTEENTFKESLSKKNTHKEK